LVASCAIFDGQLSASAPFALLVRALVEIISAPVDALARTELRLAFSGRWTGAVDVQTAAAAMTTVTAITATATNRP
jgi:hypothetical protein